MLTAGHRSSAESRRALASLCEAYWYPLYAYVRRRVSSRGDAEDMTQAFFAELLEKNYVSSADPHRGRFRAFLLTAFKSFLSKQWEKAKALKRGGGQTPLSLDFSGAESRYKCEPAAGLTPEQTFERQWAVTLLDQTMTRLRSEFVRANKEELFDELKPHLVGDPTGETYSGNRRSSGHDRGGCQDGGVAHAAEVPRAAS